MKDSTRKLDPMNETRLVMRMLNAMNTPSTKDRLSALKDYLLETDLCFSSEDRLSLIRAFQEKFDKKQAQGQKNQKGKGKAKGFINYFFSGAFDCVCKACKAPIGKNVCRFSEKPETGPSLIFCSLDCVPLRLRKFAEAARNKALKDQELEDKKLN